MKSVLFLISTLPDALTSETIDMVLISGVMEQPTTVLFIGNGVRQLTAALADLSPAKKWRALSTYDINDVYVTRSAIHKNNLDSSKIPNFVEIIKDEHALELLANTHFVVKD